MAIKLEALNTNDTLANLATAIGQFEDNGFELITFAKGIVASAQANIATFRFRGPGNAPGPLTLQPEPGANLLPQQETDLNSGEAGGKQLISYGIVLVQGKETNVAAYRG
jgi:hypothetical protein